MDLQRFLLELEEIINMESPSLEPDRVRKLSDWFRTQFNQLGWHTCQYEICNKIGPVLTASNKAANRYDVAFVAHIDTVFPLGTVKQWPFCIEGNQAHGPGTCDMKQGALGMLYLARELDEALNQELSICMVFTPDEEICTIYAKEFLQELAKRCNAVIITEAGWTDGARCVSRSGKISRRVRFHGIAAHSGYIFSAENASAILEAAHWAEALMALRSEERELTVNIGRIEGGTADNIVAEDAMISFEARYRWPEDEKRIKDTIDQMLNNPYVAGVTAAIEDAYDCPAMRPDRRTTLLIDQLKRAYETLQKELVFRHRCGLSDGNIMAQFAPVIDSMGACGQYGHCEREYMLIDTAEPSIRISLELLRQIAADKRRTGENAKSMW